MFKKLKPYVEFWAAKGMAALPRIHPNVITVLGLIPPILFYYFLSQGNVVWAIVSFCGIFLDLVDGIYARATGQTSAFGAFLDSTLDRISDAIFIAAFAAGGIISWSIAVGAIIASFLISYTRSRGELLLPNSTLVDQGPIERAERLGLLFIALLSHALLPTVQLGVYSLPELSFAVLIVLSVYTALRRIRFVHHSVNKHINNQ